MNVIEYVQTNNRRFSEEPFNHADALVFCQLMYSRIEALVEGEKLDLSETRYTVRDFYKAEYFDNMFNVGFTADSDKLLLTAAAASPRFRDIRVKHIVSEFDAEVDKQFAGMIFELDKTTDFVSFRGTDASMVGWKEDFNLSFMDEVPSQRSAVDFLNNYYSSDDDVTNIIVGGHSKGGNLAVYGASLCSPVVRSRISHVYSMDGPGFRNEVQNRLNYSGPQLNMIKIVPHSSVIGLLMESGNSFKVVESDANFIMQHDAYTWQIDGNDFIYVDDLTRRGNLFQDTILEWMERATDEERSIVVDTIFGILKDNDIEYSRDIRNADILKMISSARGITDEQEDAIKKLLGDFISSGVKKESDSVKASVKSKIDNLLT